MSIQFKINDPGVGLTDHSAILWDGGAPVSFTLQRGARGTAEVMLQITAASTYAPSIGSPSYLYEVVSGVPTCVFAGTIDGIEETWQGLDGSHVLTLSLVSLEQCFDTILVDPPCSFFGATAGYIVGQLYAIYGAGAPVGVGTISGGVTIDSLVMDHDRLTDIFDSLATQCGFIWYVDPATQTLNFCAKTTTPAPFGLTADQILWETMKYKQTRHDYRNRQTIRYSFTASNVRQERFAGDGATTLFDVSTIVSSCTRITTETGGVQATVTGTFTAQPANGDTVEFGGNGPYTFVGTLDNTIQNQIKIGATTAATLQNLVDLVNLNPSTAGTAFSLPTIWNGGFIADAPSGLSFVLRFGNSGVGGNSQTSTTTSANFSWSAGTLSGGVDATGTVDLEIGTDVFFTTGATTIATTVAPGVGDYLTVSYYSVGQDCIAVEDSTLVASRAAVEHGTGKYQQLEDDSSLTDGGVAYSVALSTLTAFKTLPVSFSFTTDQPLLLPGQWLGIGVTQPVGAPALINGNYVIQEVTGDLIPGFGGLTTGHFRYTVSVINATEIGTYVRFWENLAAAGSTGASISSSSGGGGSSVSPWGAETLASSGTVTPNASLTYHVASLSGNLTINVPVGASDGMPHTFKITCNGYDVTWAAGYVGLTNIGLDTRAGVWNTITFTTEIGGATLNYTSSVLGAS